MATQVMSRVREALRVEVGLRKLFEEPTVRGLADAVKEGGEEKRRKVEKAAEVMLRVKGVSEEEAKEMMEKRRAAGREKEK